MARLIFSGVMTRLPGLKVMAHHLGAMVPSSICALRRAGQRSAAAPRTRITAACSKAGKPLLDCFKDFYGDTALCGGRIGLTCGLDFYGPDHVLFASDAPFGPEEGRAYIRDCMAAVALLDVPAADKEKIFYRNAQAVFGLR